MVARFDCVVVGAGPAGATAAKNLAQKGWRVLLVDKATFPRDKPCGGLVSGLFQEFPYLQRVRDELVVAQNKSYWLILSNHRKRFTFNSDTYSVLRSTFDNCLVDLAKDDGVDLWERSRLLRFQWNDGEKSEWKISIKRNGVNVVRSPLIIGADGVLGMVRKLSGIKSRWLSNEVGLCLSAEYPVSEKTIEDHYGFKKTVYAFPAVGGMSGYGWVFPKRETVNIGLGGLLSTTKHIRNLYRMYLRMLKNQGIIPVNIDRGSTKSRSCLIPLTGPIYKTYSQGLLLIGDTGGFVNPLTGAGIMPGMQTGELAAQVAHSSLKFEDCSSRKLQCYDKMWKKVLGHRMKLNYLLQRLGTAIIKNPLFDILAFYNKVNKWH